jgi:lipid-binding SYLF domain-containing protein
MMKSIRKQITIHLRRQLVGAVLIGMLTALTSTPVIAADFAEQQQLVDKAKLTLEAFAADPGLKDALREWSKEAKALFIVPQFLRGAFIFGGAGGSGVLLVREDKTGKWSQPVFYTVGSASFGLQIGGDVSEMVFVVRNQKGLEEFYRSDFKLGANAGIAAGPVGGGASVHGIAADIISYASKKGAFGGIAVDGAIIAVSDESNRAYYGKPVRPIDIVAKGSVSNPKSLDLRAAAEKLMK